MINNPRADRARHRRVKAAGVAAAALAVFSTLAACSGSSDSSDEGAGSASLKIAVPSFGNQTLDPAIQDGTAVNTFILPMYDSIVELDAEGKPGPGIATSWTLSPDKTQWTFKLRTDAEFQDGLGKVTSADAAFSIKRMMNSKTTASVGGGLNSMVDSIEAPDPSTLIIKTKGVQPGLIYLLTPAEGGGLVLPEKYVTDKAGDDFDAQSQLLTSAPVGSGPYHLVSFAKSQSLKLEAVPKHWRQTPKVKKLNFLEVPDLSTEAAMLQSGEADIISASPDTARQIKASDYDIRSISGTQGIGMIFTGTWRPVAADKAAADPLVRQALSLAIDRKTLVDTVIGGYGQLADLPYGTSSATAGIEKEAMADIMKDYNDYDPQKAKQLLAQAGYADGAKGIKIYSFARATTPFAPSLIQAIEADWKKIGVSAEIVPVDYATWRPHFLLAPPNDPYNAADAAIYGLAPRLDPGALLAGQYANKGGIVQLTDGRLDDKISQLTHETDPAKATPLVTDLMTQIKDEWVSLPLFNADVLYGVNGKTVGKWKTQPGVGFLGRVFETIAVK